MPNNKHLLIKTIRSVSQRTISFYAISVLVILILIFCITTGAAFSPVFVDTISKKNNSSIPLRSDVVIILKVLGYSIKQAFFSTLLALLVGFPAAFFVSCRKFVGRNFLKSLSAVSLCIPPLLIALGYVMSFGMNGSYNKFLTSIIGNKKPIITFLYSFYGIVIAHGFYDFPIIMRTISDTWSTLKQDEYDAAKLCGASKIRIFLTITLPELAPAIASGCIIVFLYCFFSFVIVLLFGAMGCTTMEVEIYQAARNTLDFVYAGKLAIVETSAALLLTALYIILSRKGRRSTIGTTSILPSKISGPIEYICFSILIILLILFFFIPLILIIIKALPAFTIMFSRSSFWKALINTIIIAICTALLSVTAAFVFSVFSRLTDPVKKSTTLRVIPLIPMAVSSIVLGFGMTFITRKLKLPGTPILLVLAQSAISWPFALQFCNQKIERIPFELTDAAALLSQNYLDSIFRILLPLCKNAVFPAFAFSAAISAGDATLPLILGIPRFETLSLYTYRLAGAYRFPEACACGTILIVLSISLFILADRISANNGDTNVFCKHK